MSQEDRARLRAGMRLLPARTGATAGDLALISALTPAAVERALSELREAGEISESDGQFRLDPPPADDESPRRDDQSRYLDHLRGLCRGRWSELPPEPGRAARLLHHMAEGARLDLALELISERDDSGALIRARRLAAELDADPDRLAALVDRERRCLTALLPLAGRGLERLHAELRVAEHLCALKDELQGPAGLAPTEPEVPEREVAASSAPVEEAEPALETAIRLALASPDDVTMVHALAPLLRRVHGARRTAMIERFLLSLRALLGRAGDQLGALAVFALEALPPEFRERHAADLLRRCGEPADLETRAGLVAALAPFLSEEDRLRELVRLRREVPEPTRGRTPAALLPHLPAGILDELVWPVLRIADRDARVLGLLGLIRRIARLGYDRMDEHAETEIAARPDQTPAFLALVEGSIEARTAELRTAPLRTIEARPLTIKAPPLRVRTRPDPQRREPILQLLDELERSADSFLLGLGLAELAPVLPDWTIRRALAMASAIPQRADRLEALIPLAARLPDAERSAWHDGVREELREAEEPESDVYLLARLAEHRPEAERPPLREAALERLAAITDLAERARMAIQIASRCEPDLARPLIESALDALEALDPGSRVRALEEAAAIDLRLPAELVESRLEGLIAGAGPVDATADPTADSKADSAVDSAVDSAERVVARASLARLGPTETRASIADPALDARRDPELARAFVIQELAPVVSPEGRRRLVAMFDEAPDLTGASAARVALIASLAAEGEESALTRALAQAEQTGDAAALTELIVGAGCVIELDEPELRDRLQRLAPAPRSRALHALIQRHQALADDEQPLDAGLVEDALIDLFRALPEVSSALRDGPELDVSSIYLPLGGFRFADRMLQL